MVDLEESRDDKKKVTKGLKGKTMKLDSTKRCGYSFHGTWQWTHFAITRYGPEIDMMSAYVNGF